ncbi:MAG: hypothetical protein ACXVFQ_16115 [Solirubrobacteraceae bacterium]
MPTVLRESLVVPNLLVNLDALGPLLDEAARSRLWLDAFLVSAGINQIVEDSLHDSPYPFDEAASLLGKSASPAGRAAAWAAARSGIALRWLSWQTRDVEGVIAWQRRVAALVDDLADVVMADREADRQLVERCRRLAREIPSLPTQVRETVVRVPTCFHNFDQRPEDFWRLAERFIARSSGAERPLLVIGLRTSGSYLGPLLAASLRAQGRTASHVMTSRPGRTLLAHERAAVRAHARVGGQVLLVDDPPVTGSAIVKAASALQRLGIAREAVVVVLALDSADLPVALAGYDAVVLPAPEWSVRRRLERHAVTPVLRELLDEELDLRSVQMVPLPGWAQRRGHHTVLFRVSGVDRRNGATRQLGVVASAAGLGYLGAHDLAVAQTLSEFTPRVLGLRDGVLYREWLASERQMAPGAPEFPPAVASYVAARRRALPVHRDMSLAMAGRIPVWEVSATVLGRAFARLAPLARLLLVNRAVRRLLPVAAPSVIDGSMEPEHWFRGEAGERVLKVGLSDRTYWNLGLACFDASFDLAGAAAFERDAELAADVRRAWLRETGEEVDRGRWLLYELALHWGRRRENPSREPELRNASARAVARYFAGQFLADLDPVSEGPLCALDIDGVLENEQLGFPAMTRASATALRALLAHGYRPVPVTGRGIEEVQDRCRAYGLIAGVAEYGSVLCLDGGCRTVSLLDDPATRVLSRLRAKLSECDGVQLDPAYTHAVRAYRLGQDGTRRPLHAADVAPLIQACGGDAAIRAIPGESQTDFVATAVDKGTGLRALMSALGEGRTAAGGRWPELALVVGDTTTDGPMLALGSVSFVPAHAPEAATRTGAARVSRPYQAGFSQAVGKLLGHRPGTCPRCQLPEPTAESRLLLELLSVAEDGRRSLARGALKLAWELR